MGILPIAFGVGILIWWWERKEREATRQPALCHSCVCAGEDRWVEWCGGQWVHSDNGQRLFVTQLEMDVGRCLRQPPVGHPATPRTAIDAMLSPEV